MSDARATIKRRPLILTVNTPLDIIGRHNMEMFTTHMKICYSGTGGDFPEKKLNKDIGKANRELVAKLLRELRQNGFMPQGINDRGHIKWAVIARPDVMDLFDEGIEELKGKSEKELMEIARGGYPGMVRGMSVSKAKGHEMSAEREVYA